MFLYLGWGRVGGKGSSSILMLKLGGVFYLHTSTSILRILMGLLDGRRGFSVSWFFVGLGSYFTVLSSPRHRHDLFYREILTVGAKSSKERVDV